MSLLKVEIITPSKVLFSGDAALAVAPGIEGEFGIMADHAPLISALKPGYVKLINAHDKEVEKFFIAAGFCEVQNNKCTILTEEVINLSDYNKTELAKVVTDLTTELKQAYNEGDNRKAKHIAAEIEKNQLIISHQK